MASRVPIEPQRVDAPLTQSATFLVVSINHSRAGAVKTVRTTLARLADLSKNVAIRDLAASFACTVGIGSEAWESVTGGLARPAELRPFTPIRGAVHTAIATPGDLLFHIRADRRDLCFEFERQLMDLLGDAVAVVDDTIGFRYFDVRDLLGFVDGTANPVGTTAVDHSILVTQQDDPAAAAVAAGGSYVVVQKYLHDLPAWRALSTERQEAVIGRTKLDNIELDDAPAGAQAAHKTLATVQDDDGTEHSILRDNMSFGNPAAGQFGTYFIGYSRRLWVVEKMLNRMFVGVPAGLHDRILDFSTPVTGTTFFAPAASVLAGLDSD
ncbi:iron-dependent peroxidase [Capronia epimyces CBS 606.96]|uniref:Iron-dependent peroxidase n=1 Tax=Capronia epimyces CBS 606.96 TaxID=1182542 RepID=W9YGN8_9EURO|nr:iron-dependent peroxidase [Capronia epimyces CBS 606.96]EXJ81439.1 iron-dependent peroxidase [Capronia epimyces CBS 606.96]